MKDIEDYYIPIALTGLTLISLVLGGVFEIWLALLFLEVSKNG